MEFYEFNDFGYYALIGAFSEDEAIKYYNETVSDMEENKTPDTITKEEAKKKLLDICKTEEEKTEAIKEFDECTLQNETYLVLVDGSLL